MSEINKALPIYVSSNDALVCMRCVHINHENIQEELV
jgi:hypothetical protein